MATRTKARLEGRYLSPWRDGLLRMMELRGWSEAEALAYSAAKQVGETRLVSGNLAFRLGRWVVRRAVLEDEGLGPIHEFEAADGSTMAYRQKPGRPSTSWVVVGRPPDWRPRRFRR